MKDDKNLNKNIPNNLLNRYYKEEAINNKINDSFDENLEYDSENYENIIKLLNKIEYNETFERRSKNISVNVQSRLKDTKIHKISFRKYMIPIAALIAIFIYIQNNSNLNNTTSFENDNIAIIKNEEVQVLMNDIDSESLLAETITDLNLSKLSESENLEFDNILDSEMIDDILKSELKNNKENKNNLLVSNINESDIIANFSEIEEEDFQNILKGIENAKILD